jgi:streptomycin 6-kinase
VERLLKWTLAQAVLSALWSIEDGNVLHADTPTLRIASATRALLA